ncbi:conserved hypothetical protein [Gammaproteobacteria bacterium]
MKLDKHLLKIEANKDGLTMKISTKDLKFLLKHDPENTYDGEHEAVKVIKGKDLEFVEYVARKMYEIEDQETGEPCWGLPFSAIFMELYEGDGDEFVKHFD